jgi:hypothetical protein
VVWWLRAFGIPGKKAMVSNELVKINIEADVEWKA